MSRLAILGASGHGKVAADCAESCGWHEVVFFDDAWPSVSLNKHWSVIGNSQTLLDSLNDYDGVLVAIGNNRIRYDKTVQFSNAGANLVTLIHPSAGVSRYVAIGRGSVIFAGAVVNVDVTMGCAAIVNTGATVDHDCLLGDGVHISPGAHLAGGVRVGDRTWIGIGASVKQYVSIGSDVMVGAGAAVVSDVSDGRTVMGVPAR